MKCKGSIFVNSLSFFEIPAYRKAAHNKVNNIILFMMCIHEEILILLN